MNHKLFFALVSISALSIALLFNSCNSDNSVVPTQKITVTGRVLTHLNTCVSGAVVSIGDKKAISNPDGYFTINEVITPYDVYLYDSTDSKRDSIKSGFIYKNLSLENPNLILNKNTPANTCNISVVFKDELTSNKKAAIFFTDGANVNANGLSGVIDSIANMSVYLPDKKQVSGKLIALIYSVDQFQQITSYDYFGYKDIYIISSYNSITETFRQDEMTFNPPEATVSGSISNLPLNSTLNPFYLYLSFSNRAPIGYVGYMAMSNLTGNTFSVKVPAQLPIPYSPLIGGFMFKNYQNIFGKFNFVLPNSNQTGLEFNLLSEASLISPPNSSTLFNPKDNLQWNYPLTNKLFCVKIEYAQGNEIINYFIYTNSLNFTLNEISKFNFQSLYGKIFNWSVDAIGGFSTTDDLVNPSFENLLRADYFMLNKWSFTTSPVK